MKVYEFIYEGWNDCSKQALISLCNGLAWDELPVTDQEKPNFSDYKFTKNGVGVWYCYGADHYFFTDETGLNNA